LQRADVAMFEAKGQRSGVELYSQSRDDSSAERLILAGELREAVEKNKLALVPADREGIDRRGLGGRRPCSLAASRQGDDPARPLHSPRGAAGADRSAHAQLDRAGCPPMEAMEARGHGPLRRAQRI